MSGKTKTNRKQAVEMIEGSVRNFFQKAKDAKQVVYIDLNGKEHRECAGTYNDYLVRAMCCDMSKLWIHLNVSGSELAEEVSGWETKMQDLNFAILRQMDDYNGDRPVIPLIKDGDTDPVEELLKSMTKVKKSGALDHDEWLCKKNICEKMDQWVERIIYITSWAYYIEQMTNIEDALFDSQIREYDSDNRLLSGLDDDTISFIESVCEMRKLFLKAYLRIPVRDADSKILLEKLNLLDIMTQAAMEGKLEQMLQLLEKKI